MERRDDRLKRDLAEGPLRRGGFDERLRRRIEERLDEPAPRRRWFTLRFAGAGAGMLVMLAAVILLVSLHPLQSRQDGLPAADTAAEQAVTASSSAPAAGAEAVQAGRAVLLLGLRHDDGEGGSSAYRTLLVSAGPAAADWSITEGEGIVLPHRIDFWRLDLTETAAGSHAVRLVGAYNTALGDEAPLPFAGGAAAVAGEIEERILFAGNRYVALVRRMGGNETFRVMDINDLGKPRSVVMAASGGERHMLPALQEGGTLGVMASDELGASGTGDWTVGRIAGRWVGMSAEVNAASREDGSRTAVLRPRTLQTLPYTLGSSVVAHNELSLSWGAVRSAIPAAVDAFTSPSRNMAVIVTDRQIAVHEMKGGELGGEMLVTALREGESVVMAEWATNEAYIDMWLEKVGALLRE